jgi:hypothetical protein
MPSAARLDVIRNAFLVRPAHSFLSGISGIGHFIKVQPPSNFDYIKTFDLIIMLFEEQSRLTDREERPVSPCPYQEIVLFFLMAFNFGKKV